MSEGKHVSLFTKASQIDKEGSKSNIEFYVEASYTEKGSSKYITYKETAASGMEGTTTTLKLDEDSLSIIRFGTYSSKLHFKSGEKTTTTYQTPYGAIPIIINTSLLDIALKPEASSTIKLRYSLESGGEEVYNNEVLISFK